MKSSVLQTIKVCRTFGDIWAELLFCLNASLSLGKLQVIKLSQ